MVSEKRKQEYFTENGLTGMMSLSALQNFAFWRRQIGSDLLQIGSITSHESFVTPERRNVLRA